MSSNEDQARRSETDAWGIYDGYCDALGEWRQTGKERRNAILRAMGAHDPADRPPDDAPVRVVVAGQTSDLAEPSELSLEDGTVLPIAGRLPKNLPNGYHWLRPLAGGDPVRLIVSPGRCHLPDGLKTWGWAVQLYALRSRRSWGIGDFADLRRLNAWSAKQLGAGMVLLNPLGGGAPLSHQQASPYSPVSRRFKNPLYLRIEEVPGADELAAELAPTIAAGQALNAERRIDRDAVFRLKLAALERLFDRFQGDPRFDAFCQEQGQPLEQFATYSLLAEQHGANWRVWPADYRDPDSGAVFRARLEHGKRVRFHAWLQWLIDLQLERAGVELAIMQDLPIGFDPNGADAWVWQRLIAPGMSVGAPPDDFNTHGQDWRLPPFVPHKLRQAAYEPFIQTIRSTLRHAQGLRIDHVMGLFRLYWVPDGGKPKDGAYVRYPADDLLAILALESERAGAIVVGEDLGTIEPGVRERLADCRVLSYRLLWFEDRPPEEFPRLAMSAATTHDLPTMAGLWSGADAAAQREIGLEANVPGIERLAAKLREITQAAADTPLDEVVRRAHQVLARTPSVFVTATLEDALLVPERPNVPGTTTEYPNWSLALPVPLEEIEQTPLARQIGETLAGR